MTVCRYCTLYKEMQEGKVCKYIHDETEWYRTVQDTTEMKDSALS